MSDVQIIDFNESCQERQMEMLRTAVGEGMYKYQEVIDQRMSLLLTIYGAAQTFIFGTLKELNIVPTEMNAYVHEAMTMSDYQFEHMIDADNAFGLPVFSFIDRNEIMYTVFATACIYEDDMEDSHILFAVSKKENGQEYYLNSEHEWHILNKEIKIEDDLARNYNEATATQKMILNSDDQESSFMECVLQKYGRISDEKYFQIRDEHETLIVNSLTTDGYFELTSDGEIVLRDGLRMGFCVTEKDGKWNIYQYLSHDDLELMGYDCGDLRDYKKLIGTTNDGLQALRLFDESDDDLELVIPVSAKNAIEVPEFLFMSDIKNVTESKSRYLNRNEKKNLNEFCDWLLQFPPFDCEDEDE